MSNPNIDPNVGESQNTFSQSSEHPAAIIDNDPLELLNLALARLAHSESLLQNSCHSGVWSLVTSEHSQTLLILKAA